MRKFVTTAAAALALTFGLAAPAFADHDQYNNYPYQGGYNQNYGSGAPQGGYGDPNRYPNNGRFDQRYYDNYNFDRHDRTFDRWERGWNDYGHNQYRYQRTLAMSELRPRLAAQGFYGVRKVKKDRWGAYRAFGFNRRGMPVMLRINAYTGRVIDVRYI